MSQIRGKGSIVQLEKNKRKDRCRKWQIRISTGKSPSTGKYKTITRVVHGSFSFAQAELNNLIKELENIPTYNSFEDPCFGEYAEHWLNKRKSRVSANTIAKNTDHIKNLNLHLRFAKLKEITPSMLECTYQDLLNGKSVSGRKLSGTFVASIACTASLIFKDAMSEGIILFNPCLKASRPAIDTKERVAIRCDDMAFIIKNLEVCNPIQFGIRFILRTGLRVGEIAGLSLGDYNATDKTIYVHCNYDRFGNLKPTKTKAGTRELPLSDKAIDDLETYIAYLESSFADIRSRLNSESPVLSADAPLICNELGERFTPNYFTNFWRKKRIVLGFDHINLHDLRHSFISELARRKVDPKSLQKIAGHSNISTTLNIYTHVDLEDKRNAIRSVDW